MLARPDDSALDSGRKNGATERMCALTREVKPVEALIRFVVAPDGLVVADIKRNLPGRGLWVSASHAAVAEATRRRLFARGFKREVRQPEDLAGETERLLRRAALDALAIAGKAGEVVTGFAKVEVAIGRGGVIGLIHAAEAAPDGTRKLDAALRRTHMTEVPQIPAISAFTGAELDLALGRPNVIHAALLAGPASQGFLTRCLRMKRFRTGETSRSASDRASDKGPTETQSGSDSE
jgi:predicted RNA-binding protein YlxR (DUF448 family)